MAVKYILTGSTDASLAASWDAVTLPSAGDAGYLRDGVQTIVTGLTAVALNRLSVTPGFRGRIGTPSTPVSWRVDNGSSPYMEIEGAEYVNISASTAISRLICNTSAPVYLNGATVFAKVLAKIGSVEIGANTPVTTLIVKNGRVYQYANATANTLAVVGGGTLITKRSATTLTAGGNSQVWLLDASAFTTINLSGNARLFHQSTGTIGVVNLYDNAVISPGGALQDTAVTTLNRYGGTVVERSGSINMVIGTFNDETNAGAVTEDRFTSQYPLEGG